MSSAFAEFSSIFINIRKNSFLFAIINHTRYLYHSSFLTPKLSQHFLSCDPFPHNGVLRQAVPADIVYQ